MLLVAVLVFSLLLAGCNYFMLKSEHLNNKKIIGFCFLELVFTVSLSFITYLITKSDTEKSDNILSTGRRTEELTKQIERLSLINDSIAAHSDSLTIKIDTLTQRANKLIGNIDTRTEQQSEENALTGQFNFDFGKPLYDTSTITVVFGTITGVNTIKPDPKIWYKAGMHLIHFSDGFEPITFDLKNHRLVLSLKVYDLNGNLIVSIDNNYWHRYVNNTGIFNYDKRGFEVFDNRGNIALNVNLISKDTIVLQGYLIERKYHFIMIAGQEVSVPWQWGDPRGEAQLIDEVNKVKIRQLFVYTGLNWLHKRQKAALSKKK